MSKCSELMCKAFTIRDDEAYMDMETKINDLYSDIKDKTFGEISYSLMSDADRGELMLNHKRRVIGY